MPLTYTLDATFIDNHRNAIKFSCVLQLLILLLTSILLDRGATMKVALLGAIAYWVVVFAIMLRRDGHETLTDRIMLRWGFLPMIVLSGAMLSCLARLLCHLNI